MPEQRFSLAIGVDELEEALAKTRAREGKVVVLDLLNPIDVTPQRDGKKVRLTLFRDHVWIK